MSNKLRLSNNNIDLQELIERANELPHANEWERGTDIMPGTSDVVIPAYINKELIIKGDSNLIASNIKEGINIFGINGTLTQSTKWWETGYKAANSTIYTSNSNPTSIYAGVSGSGYYGYLVGSSGYASYSGQNYIVTLKATFGTNSVAVICDNASPNLNYCIIGG